MSLQVWLPLNGDLTQQGLSGVEVTNNSATVNNEGKIGKCYQFGTATSYMTLPAESMIDFTEASLSFWVKILSWNTSYATLFQAGTSGYSWQNYIFGVLRNATNSTLCFTIGNGSTTSTTTCQTSALELNTWYHLTFTYNNNGDYCIYINGVLNKKSHTDTIIPAFSQITMITLGRANGNGYQSNCLMNDVRIYNHCLSAKEIKELSKGLVLHYKFDDPYIETTTNLNPTVRPATGANATWGGHVAQWTNYDATYDPVPFNEGTKCEIVYGENGSTGGGASRSIATIAAEPSTTYTYSCYIKPEDDFAYVTANLIYKFEYNGGTKLTEAGYFSKSRIEPVGDGWYRCWGTFTSRDTTTAINISFYTYPLKTITYWIGGWQIEKNDHMTPFVEPGTTRAGAVFDNSGYDNNGVPIGGVSYSNDTIKYNKSLSLNGTDGAIQVPYNTIAWQTNFTINLWWKKTEIGPENYETLFGGPSGFEMDTRVGSLTALTLYMANIRGGNVYTGFELNNWYMVTLVNDGTNELYFVNGNLVKTIGKKSMPNGNYFIGAWNNSSSQNYKGLMSDFRIYATALSADDILELYHTAASIDNQGNLFCGEVVE